jgi:hypothetical protein
MSAQRSVTEVPVRSPAMTAPRAGPGAVALVLLLAAGCGASAASLPRRDAGSPGAGGAGGTTGGAATGGGGGSAGAGGSGGGSTGTGGSGGGVVDAGAADASGKADGGAQLCSVVLSPVAPARWINIPVGKPIRVHAEITGMPPTPVTWRWSVMFQGEWKMLAANGAEADVPLDRKGQYTIRAEAASWCSGTAQALAVDPAETSADYWVRAVPPSSLALPTEVIVTVPPGKSVVRPIALTRGWMVALDPQGESGVAVPSYLRITSRTRPPIDGHTGDRPFMVMLDKGVSYDVLVIPDGALAAGAPSLPPDVLQIPVLLPNPPLVLRQGVPISGQLTGPHGALVGGRVLLRAAALPSTLGVSGADGRFALAARAGSFAALLVPPPDSGLLQARLPEGSVVVDRGPVSLDFRWQPLAALALDLAVRSPDGATALAGVTARLESDAVPAVGTLTIDGGSPLDGTGLIRVEAVTDARGIAHFSELPAALYTVTLLPAGGGAVTTAPLDLGQATGQVARMVRLGRPLDVAGRLVPASLGAGATVVAVDPGADPARPVPAAIADPSGVYRLAVDPGRQYRLFVEPSPARGLARIALGAVAGDADVPLADHRLPAGVAITGTATVDGVAAGGILVQAYCLGEPPDCKGPASPTTESMRPVAEAVTDRDGSFRLVVPDPAMVY